MGMSGRALRKNVCTLCRKKEQPKGERKVEFQNRRTYSIDIAMKQMNE